MARVAVNMCEDVFGNLEEARPAIVCHSLGSHVAFEMVRQSPKSFSSIVLISPAGLRPHKALQPWCIIRPLSVHILRHPTSLLTRIVSFFLPTVYGFLGFPPLPTSEFVYSQTRIALIDYPAHHQAVASHPTSVPVLLAYSPDDPVVNEAVTLELLKALEDRFASQKENFHVLKFTSGGHAVQKTHAEPIAAAMVDRKLIKM
eukprot:TRINITY_DN42385_c0_g1_i1.p1 TRINITY_DN42385_c0_g1~~TRINITY_DN42385_c0_g1_i1.p1  ORF type:complete len:220 (+),score=26.26 TRINITY_DN42385_c0_g1_i1:57-662(+)